jgi:hypothetical protein
MAATSSLSTQQAAEALLGVCLQRAEQGFPDSVLTAVVAASATAATLSLIRRPAIRCIFGALACFSRVE